MPPSHSAILQDVLKPVPEFTGDGPCGDTAGHKGQRGQPRCPFVFEFSFDAWRGKSPRKQAVSLSGLISRRASAIAAHKS
ncbi:hypothetical protein MPL1032_180401 [Mesorhizobium plurifarium]|uniref:Uncharacterized protein n=1 Tax=Mesorhizobium plurifarium TaxID=69974 RepID=A0A0K2VV87_MESPL|nr:hypothetical protein MPL1032_180401 [Mesorhizobium plurifarium]